MKQKLTTPNDQSLRSAARSPASFHFVLPVLYARVLPAAQSPLASHTRAAAHFLRNRLRGNVKAQHLLSADEDDMIIE